MSEAGPSRPRQSNGSHHSSTQRHSNTNGNRNGNGNGDGHSGGRPSNGSIQATQKRKRITSVNEIFEKPDLEEQVKLSREYRALQNEAEESRANLANLSVRDVAQALRKQDDLFVNVRDTGIGALDANLMKTTTETAMALAKKFKIDGVAFDIDDFLLKVKGKLGLDRIQLEDQEVSSEDELDEDDEGDRARGARKGVLGDWEKIGWMAAKYCRRIPGVEFMYGPLSLEHKKRKVGLRQKKQALAPEVRPEEVQTQKGESKGKDDFASNVRIVKKVLDRLDPDRAGVNFFELVVNPADYGQTVENCFFVSFLLNQGLAGMSVTEEGEVIIRSTEPHDVELHGEVIKNQAVVELDIETWEQAKMTFDIRKSNIPHRDYTKIRQMSANGWYT